MCKNRCRMVEIYVKIARIWLSVKAIRMLSSFIGEGLSEPFS